MDTERDENQNLKNDIDRRENYSINTNDSEDSLKQKWHDNELGENEHLENTDYAEDQNNSSTGYTQKLLEKELEHGENNEEDDIENDSDSDVEEDLIIKNGIIINDKTDIWKSWEQKHSVSKVMNSLKKKVNDILNDIS